LKKYATGCNIRITSLKFSLWANVIPLLIVINVGNIRIDDDRSYLPGANPGSRLDIARGSNLTLPVCPPRSVVALEVPFRKWAFVDRRLIQPGPHDLHFTNGDFSGIDNSHINHEKVIGTGTVEKFGHDKIILR
jgi:hypothetical protein